MSPSVIAGITGQAVIWRMSPVSLTPARLLSMMLLLAVVRLLWLLVCFIVVVIVVTITRRRSLVLCHETGVTWYKPRYFAHGTQYVL